MATRPKAASPNPEIDGLIKSMMTKAKGKKGEESIPPDTVVKILNAAIAWEKVKHHINDAEGGFDPDNI